MLLLLLTVTFMNPEMHFLCVFSFATETRGGKTSRFVQLQLISEFQLEPISSSSPIISVQNSVLL